MWKPEAMVSLTFASAVPPALISTPGTSTRTTSAVELYGPNGRLVSRFALNLPEYTTTTYLPGRCEDWDLTDNRPDEPISICLGEGDRLELEVTRGGADRTVEVELATRPQQTP